MFPLESILRYSEENSRSIVVILIGLIIIGSTGGGFWIRSLQTNLSEKDRLVNERLKLIEERYKSEVHKIRSEFRTLHIRFSEMVSVFNQYKDNINNLTSLIKQSTNKSNIDKFDIENISSAAEKLLQNFHYINRDLDFIELSTSHLKSILPKSSIKFMSRYSCNLIRIFILFVIIVLIYTLIFITIKRFVKRYRRKKLENFVLNKIKGKVNPSYHRRHTEEVESMMLILDYGNRKKVEIVKKLAENFAGEQ